MLRQFLGDTPTQDQLALLEPRLAAIGLTPAEAIPLIAPLLNLPLWAGYPPLRIISGTAAAPPVSDAGRMGARFRSAQPLVIATEDLHWVDPSTLELIPLLVE
jgi:predicted ATPase